MGYQHSGGGRTVEVIGHRGSPRRFRENTVLSFVEAFAEGADAVELDVHGTLDGVVVVHHDPVTNTRSGDSGEMLAIASTRLDAVRAVRTGDTAIPTLQEMLAIVPATASVYVEVKAPGIEHAVVHAVRTTDRTCAVHSFDHRISRRVHELAPELAVGILQTSYPVDPLRPLQDAGARDLWQQWEMIDEALIATLHDDGRRVVAWTVNDSAVAVRLVSWGIDAICTDLPSAMRTLVDERAPP